VEKGRGSKLYDVDGNTFTDFICSLGAITLGYNFKPTNKAIKKQLNKGIIFSTQSQLEIQLAEILNEIIPGAESVRFLKNGSDATTSAVKLARAFTKKDIILMSGYHGMDDWSIGTTVNNNGVPKDVQKLTDTFEYNDIDSLQEKFNKYKANIAAVILEPIQGNGPKKDYLQKIKKLCEENNALLIFDEVVSGFRYALGGAAELYKVTPDLAAYGKGMANGMPLSFVSGRKEIMSLIGKDVFVSTTFGGENLSLASAIATIRFMKKNNTIEKLWHLGEYLQKELIHLIDKYGFNPFIDINGLPPRNGIIFKTYDNIDSLVYQTMYQKFMLEEGFLTFGVNNLMHSHSLNDIKRFIAKTEMVFSRLKSIIFSGEIKELKNDDIMKPIFQRNK
jgi:glutamate-1-semialdehyde aminotransferase